VFRKVYDLVFYGGYLAASEAAVDDVVARYSRGNIAIQFKRYLAYENGTIQALRKMGDRAARSLARRIGRSI
jgi:hypothetical protein